MLLSQIRISFESLNYELPAVLHRDPALAVKHNPLLPPAGVNTTQHPPFWE